MTRLASIRWTTNRVLAALALGLGVVALAGDPVRGHTVRIDTQELATIVEGKTDHVTAAELADWIVRGATDYRLVDVRTPAEYDAHHIPTAENVPIAQLPDFGLGRNEKIVLYSEGGIHAAQAWFLLRAQGYTGAYILFGGLEAWDDEVLHPMAPVDSTPEAKAAFARAAEVARLFGGAPRAASAATATAERQGAPAAPVLDPRTVPVPPASPARRAGPPAPKRKEGC